MAPKYPYAFKTGKKEAAREEFIDVLHRVSARIKRVELLPNSEELHEIRTLIKLLRTLLWLAKPSLHRALASRVKKKLRIVALALANSRDATVVNTTLADLKKEAGGSAEREAIQVVQRALAEPPENSQKLRSRLKQARGNVLMAIKQLEEAAHSNSEWSSPRQRLKKAFSQASSAHTAARRDGTALRYHAWRKKAKQLFYLLRLLEPKPDKKSVRMIEDLDKLQDTLGNYHDGVVLHEKLKTKLSPEEARPALMILKERQLRQQKKTEKLFRRIGF